MRAAYRIPYVQATNKTLSTAILPIWQADWDVDENQWPW
jgi:hypothetical protein